MRSQEEVIQCNHDQLLLVLRKKLMRTKCRLIILANYIPFYFFGEIVKDKGAGKPWNSDKKDFKHYLANDNLT